MIFDWVVSLVVASMVALTLALVGAGAVAAIDRSQAVTSALDDVATTIATHVDRDEGLLAATQETFTYGTVIAPGGSGDTLPSAADGYDYQLLVTPDFLEVSANVPGGTVSRTSSFNNPVHLFGPSVLQQLSSQGMQTTEAQLHGWDQANACIEVGAGIPFTVSVVEVWVDASPTYLTLFYPVGYTPAPNAC